jgi:TonB family protein
MLRIRYLRCAPILLAIILSTACNDPARPGNKVGNPVDATLLCACKPTHITPDDWRIEFKNGSLPQTQPTEISVATMLAWPQGPEPGRRTPRSGRELTLFHVPRAYLQAVFLRKGDCDLHIEVSEQPDKNAPRMIIETPGSPEYCPARTGLYAGMLKRAITITDLAQEIAQPIPVEITGVAFRDEAHPVWFARGGEKVATLWELHPAIVKALSPDTAQEKAGIGQNYDVKRCAPRVVSYPKISRNGPFKTGKGEKWTNAPTIGFEILESGGVANAQIKGSSGVRNIDAYALDSIKGTKYNGRPECGVVESEASVTVDVAVF